MAKKKQVKTEKLVSSEIEITKPAPKKAVKVIPQIVSLKQYRSSVDKVAEDVKRFALKQSDNLLTVKMGLMGAVREVEVMLKQRKEGG